jgi:hypothetical protein
MDGKITLNLQDHVRFDPSNPTPLLNCWFGPLDCKMATEWYKDVASLRLRHLSRLLLHLQDEAIEHDAECVCHDVEAVAFVREAIGRES